MRKNFARPPRSSLTARPIASPSFPRPATASQPPREICRAATRSGHIGHSTLKKQHRLALQLSGVRPFILYSLRHSFATRIAPHVDAWTLCKVMGWSSLSVAMTYIHPSEDRVLDAFSDMGGHNFGHNDSRKELPGVAVVLEVAERQ